MPNLLATAAVVGEAVLLAKAPTLRQDLDTTPLSFPAKIVACAWVLLFALPPSLPQPEHESCRTSVRYQASCQCFRICLFLPTATILLLDANQGDSWAALLLLFVIATTVLAQDPTSLAVAAHQQDVVADPLALLVGSCAATTFHGRAGACATVLAWSGTAADHHGVPTRGITLGSYLVFQLPIHIWSFRCANLVYIMQIGRCLGPFLGAGESSHIMLVSDATF